MSEIADNACRPSQPAWRALGAAVAVCFVTLALVFPYAWLQADDFCRAAGAAERGVVASVATEYRVWSGRWMGIGIEYTVLALPAQLLSYRVALAVFAAIYLLSVDFLLAALLPKLPRRARWLTAGALFALYWAGLPSTRDTMYWLCGAVEYQLSIALSLACFAALVRQSMRNPPALEKAALALVATLAAATVSGIHELFALMLVLVLAVATALAMWWRSAGRWTWAWVALVATVGFAICYFAPGNAVRIGLKEDFGNPRVAIPIAANAALSMLPDWVFDVRLLSATCLVVLLAQRGALQIGDIAAARRRMLRWVVPLVGCALLAAAFLGPAWGTGIVVASRTLAPAYMLFLLTWFATLLLWMPPADRSQAATPFCSPAAATLLVWVLAGSLVLTGNTRRAVKELLTTLPAYQTEKTQREQLLREAAKNSSAASESLTVIPPLAARPQMVNFADITTDTSHWINGCAATYYGLRSVKVADDPPRD